MKYGRLLQISLKIRPQDNEVELLYNYPIRFPVIFNFNKIFMLQVVKSIIIILSDCPNPSCVVTNVCKHKLAYEHFFKMADDCLTFSQLFARPKRDKRTKTKN